MSETKHMLFARNLICICIDGKENADYQGKIWHQYSDDPIEFESAIRMLGIMDDLMDEWDFPQRGLEDRSFDKNNRKKEQLHAPDEELTIDKVQEMFGIRNIQNRKGMLSTFVVQVGYRQRATWQGHVVCVEANELKEFESAMALLRIIDLQNGLR